MKKNIFALGLMAAVLTAATSGCSKHSKPNFVYMPDMASSPALKYQEPGMQPPVAGTIPRGYEPMPATMTLADAGRTYKNPLQRTSKVLARGQQMYNTYCIVCHGPQGEGDGSVVPKFPRPPSLLSDKIRNYADGNIYYVISAGQNLMPSYKSQIAKADRWAIIHYIRAFQRAKKPSAQDIKEYEAE